MQLYASSLSLVSNGEAIHLTSCLKRAIQLSAIYPPTPPHHVWRQMMGLGYSIQFISFPNYNPSSSSPQSYVGSSSRASDSRTCRGSSPSASGKGGLFIMLSDCQVKVGSETYTRSSKSQQVPQIHNILYAFSSIIIPSLVLNTGLPPSVCRMPTSMCQFRRVRGSF